MKKVYDEEKVISQGEESYYDKILHVTAWVPAYSDPPIAIIKLSFTGSADEYTTLEGTAAPSVIREAIEKFDQRIDELMDEVSMLVYQEDDPLDSKVVPNILPARDAKAPGTRD